MREKTQSVLWNILLLVSIAFLSFAGFSQWNRYHAAQSYEALRALKSGETELEEVQVYLPSEDFEQDHAGDEFAINYRENPAREWLDINPDYIGWISIENTNINYPYVRSMDNEDYLNRDFYRQKSASGAIFMDYRNLGNFNDNHMILYGHNMKSKTMFHQLNNYQEKTFFEENPIIEISGLYGSKTFRIFSVYEVSANDYAFNLTFHDKEDYGSYLESLAALSLHSAGRALDPGYKLLTLATCSYGVDNGRFVVHALEM